jgi:L-fucose mutarotase
MTATTTPPVRAPGPIAGAAARLVDVTCTTTYTAEIDFTGGRVLSGVHPLLTGELLAHLDAMGHSDAVVVADAHFPAARLASRLLTFPGLSTPAVLGALRSVLPLDDAPALDLMASADGSRLPVQDELITAAGAGADDVRFLDRHEFYDVAATAYLVVRTGETRVYGNAVLRKGVVDAGGGPR